MQVYLVGGAVRDEILKNPIKDNDYVVVGGTPEYFLKQGYEQVGADFPVFLHPETKDEYALARKERKTGLGYAGFTCEYDPTISLKDDLYRRDLTINALAKNIETGEIIDYFGGLKDIENKTLRHISKHFRDDPLRLLRIARFAARYKEQGFTIANETFDLMKEMIDNGEINHLTPERVKLETDKALLENNPSEYFFILRECGALKILFPEIDKLFGVPQPKEHHPEIDTGIHTMLVIEQAKNIAEREKLNKSEKLLLMWTSLLHDLGKGETPQNILPQHINHEVRGADIIRDASARLKLTNDESNFSILCSLIHTKIHSIKSIKSAKKILTLIQKSDWFRNPRKLEIILLACEADARGRTGYENRDYNQPQYLTSIIEPLKFINQKEIAEKVKQSNSDPKLLGIEIANSINEQRKQVIHTNLFAINQSELFFEQYRFLKGINNQTDINNAIKHSKKLANNNTLLNIVLKKLNISETNNHVIKILNFGRELKTISNQQYLDAKIPHQEIGKMIFEDKFKLFKKHFPTAIKKDNGYQKLKRAP